MPSSRGQRAEQPARAEAGTRSVPAGKRASAFRERLQRPAHPRRLLASSRPSDRARRRCGRARAAGRGPRPAPAERRVRRRHERRLERRRDRLHLDAEQQRQRVRGHVVGPPRRAARAVAQVGIALPLEQRLGERRSPAAASARRASPPGSAGPRPSNGARRPLDLDLPRAQHVDEPRDGRRVALSCGSTNANGSRRALARRLASSAVRSQCSRFARRVLQDRERGVELRLDDVAQPPACRPARAAGSCGRRLRGS